MTLVGPRPCLEWEAEMFPSEFDERFAVRPGMTGLWQVSGRSTMGTLDMLRLDVHYVRHQTLRGDVAILARTVPAVLRGDGADEYGDRGQPDEYGDRGQPDGGCRRSSYRSPLARARGDGGRKPVHFAALDQIGVRHLRVHTAGADRHRCRRTSDRRLRMGADQ